MYLCICTYIRICTYTHDTLVLRLWTLRNLPGCLRSLRGTLSASRQAGLPWCPRTTAYATHAHKTAQMAHNFVCRSTCASEEFFIRLKIVPGAWAGTNCVVVHSAICKASYVQDFHQETLNHASKTTAFPKSLTNRNSESSQFHT